MNRKKTEDYYAALSQEDLCSCAYCRNFMAQVREAYPEAAAYLRGLGADIEKPFETMPIDLEPEDAVLYVGVQYVILGSPSDFEKTKIGDISVDIAGSHPVTDITEEHFVIELAEMKLK